MAAYANMGSFLFPSKNFESMYSVFAISASYSEDVIEGKHEHENLKELFEDTRTKLIEQVLESIRQTLQLAPLSSDEIREILHKLIFFHGRAYGWEPKVGIEDIQKAVEGSGYLLRTKIRAAIEYLDQIYQYGEVGTSSAKQLSLESFEEELPGFEAMLDQ
jgi:hypothetical protein